MLHLLDDNSREVAAHHSSKPCNEPDPRKSNNASETRISLIRRAPMHTQAHNLTSFAELLTQFRIATADV
jgi:hypothetical protein